MPDAFLSYLKLGWLRRQGYSKDFTKILTVARAACLGGLVAAERQSGMLELCRNYAGAMLGFLDPFQKRPRPVLTFSPKIY